MATIKTCIMVQDSMSPAIRSMSTACRILVNDFTDMRNVSSNTVDTRSLKIARDELDNVDMILNQVEQQVQNVNNESKQLDFNNATSSANGLLSKVKQIAIAAGGLALINKTVNLSDQVSSNRARLSLIVDDNGSVEALENKIFAMSNRTRSSFLDTTSVVSKLGILAGDNFKNTDEIIAFTELMNKNFAIGGASVQEQTSAMYQLTQAMAAGKLQGDEFRSIIENAPLLAEAIAKYTRKSKGELKELSSDGVITSDIIKNAMFSAADQINDRYNKMPITWAQVWNKVKNITIKALDPVLIKINQLANNQQVQEMFTMFINGASLAAQAILGLIEGIAWLINVLEPVTPLILGIVGGYLAWQIASGIMHGILVLETIAQFALAAATGTKASADLIATGTQLGLNSAMLACPAFWIVIAIFALIVALTYLWFTNDTVAKYILMAWDNIQIAGMSMWFAITQVFYGIRIAGMMLLAGMAMVCWGLSGAWYGLQTGLEAVGVGILQIFQWLYNGVVDIVKGIIDAINNIPGVEISANIDKANFADKALEGMKKNVIDRNEVLQGMLKDANDAQNKAIEIRKEGMVDGAKKQADILNKQAELDRTRDDRVEHRNDWISGASSAIKDAMNTDSFDFSNMGNSALGDIAGDTKKIADNSEISEEDLKYLIDIAERDTINRFTTAEIKVDMTNHNNINSELDIDGIVTQLGEKLEEEMQVVAEGVHS